MLFDVLDATWFSQAAVTFPILSGATFSPGVVSGDALGVPAGIGC
jgi:hypothetical protein